MFVNLQFIKKLTTQQIIIQEHSSIFIKFNLLFQYVVLTRSIDLMIYRFSLVRLHQNTFISLINLICLLIFSFRPFLHLFNLNCFVRNFHFLRIVRISEDRVYDSALYFIHFQFLFRYTNLCPVRITCDQNLRPPLTSVAPFFGNCCVINSQLTTSRQRSSTLYASPYLGFTSEVSSQVQVTD